MYTLGIDDTVERVAEGDGTAHPHRSERAHTTSSYDERGNLLRTTDALGNITEYAYDERGNLLRTTDALGNTNHFTYDNRGQMITETNPLGLIAVFGSGLKAAEWMILGQGRPLVGILFIGLSLLPAFRLLAWLRHQETREKEYNFKHYDSLILGYLEDLVDPEARRRAAEDFLARVGHRDGEDSRELARESLRTGCLQEQTRQGRKLAD